MVLFFASTLLSLSQIQPSRGEIMSRRNWQTIGKLPNFMRFELMTTMDKALLERFERGFPELFVPGEDEHPLQGVLCLIAECAIRRNEHDNGFFDGRERVWKDCHFYPGSVLLWSSVSFPKREQFIIKEWIDGGDTVWNGRTVREMARVLDQLVGQRAEMGMTVTYEGKSYMVWELEGHDLEVGSTITDSDLDSISDLQIIEVKSMLQNVIPFLRKALKQKD
jgi:hypothetical protein